MKHAVVLLCSVVFAGIQMGAQEIHSLPAFDKIKTGPRIELDLTEGSEPAVWFDLDGVDMDVLNFEVRNGTLNIYLDGARNLEPRRKIVTNYGKVRESIYADCRVTAHITFRNLNKLVMKGEEDARIDGNVQEETFKLKVFGDADVSFEKINIERLKVKMFGDCALTVDAGHADRQKYTIFGDHLIDTQHLSGRKVKATSLGDSYLRVNGEIVKITALGEADISCPSDTRLKKIVIGESSVQRYTRN